ncbi:hypothetical protein CDG76_01760 [Nostoc sp. 'Peltigera membranacea cyanobiont' 210A]|nr:hypothetical protein CDG76_01760 [Nostoc sp. 'Peltigera membranacea cyanobiont' 210A]
MKIYKCFYEIVIKSLSFTIPALVQILRRNYVILTLLLALNFIAATRLRCTISGHTEAGMTGEIAIKN